MKNRQYCVSMLGKQTYMLISSFVLLQTPAETTLWQKWKVTWIHSQQEELQCQLRNPKILGFCTVERDAAQDACALGLCQARVMADMSTKPGPQLTCSPNLDDSMSEAAGNTPTERNGFIILSLIGKNNIFGDAEKSRTCFVYSLFFVWSFRSGCWMDN